MNSVIRSLLEHRIGRWVMIQVHGTVFVGKLIELAEDGAIIEATSGRTFAISGQIMLLAADVESEADLEEKAAKRMAEPERTTH